MNKNIFQSLIFAAIVLGLSYLVFWGPIVFLNLKAANLIEGKIYNPVAFTMFVLGGFVPSVVGIILTCIVEGRRGFNALMASAINVRIGYRSWLSIFGYVLILAILQVALFSCLGGKFDSTKFLVQLPTIIPLIVLGPLSEKFGWRGFLQKRLNNVFNPFLSSIFIGCVWSFWHLPLFYMNGASQHEFGIPFLSFLVSVSSSAFVYTYIFQVSKGSLFSAILLHWIGTYVMQVIGSQVYAQKIANYNLMESIPTVVLAGVFVLLIRKSAINKTQYQNNPT